MGATLIAPPPGFVDEDPPIPEGFQEDAAEPPIPEGFMEEGAAAAAPAPSSSPVDDFARRVASGVASATAGALSGITKIEDDFTISGAARKLVKSIGGPDISGGFRGFLGEITKASPETYGVDPSRDDQLQSKVAGGLGSIVPILASGPFAPLTGAGMMGESGRKEAEDAGATPLQQNASFYANAALGAATEALMGVPALLRSAKATAPGGSLLTNALTQGAKSVVREGAQEGSQQLGSNLIASEGVAYDPDRPAMQGVGEAALIGGIVGGPVGAGVQTTQDLTTRRINADLAKLDIDITAFAEGRATVEDLLTPAPVPEITPEMRTVRVTEAPTAPEVPGLEAPATPEAQTPLSPEPAAAPTVAAEPGAEEAGGASIPALREGVEASSEGAIAPTAQARGKLSEPSTQADAPSAPQATTTGAVQSSDSQIPSPERIREDLPEARPIRDRIDAIVKMAEDRHDKMQMQVGQVRDLTQPVDLLTTDEKTELHSLQMRLRPKSSQEARADILARRAARKPPLTPEAPQRGVEAGEDVAEIKRSGSALGFAAIDKPTEWLTNNVKRLFSAEGDLPREVFDRWGAREAEVKSITREVAYTSRDLYDALAKEYGISKSRRFTKGFADVPPADVKKLNAALAGEVDIETLPESVRGPLQSMRQQIDALSQRMLDEGLIDGDLAAKVEGNLGTYLTRSYRVFDDPKWKEQIPTPVKNRALSYLQSELRKTNPAANEVDASRLMNSLLEDWQGQNSKGGMGKLGSKDLSILIKRKDIAPEIRALMGEYSSPVVNYARSVSKMASLLASSRFLADVKGQGMGKWLFENGKEQPGFSAEIAAEGSDVMSPLNGLRTSPEIAAAFAEFGKVQNSDSALFRTWMTVTAFAKATKTVGSVMTQARNLFGQAYFLSMNGHFDLRPVKQAIMGTAADIGAVKDTQWRDYFKRMLELGIVDQSAKAGELRDAIKEAGLNDANLSEFSDRVLLKNLSRATVGAAIRGYQLSDDIGKIVGFENEAARLRDINPEWTPQQVDVEASKRIREIYPTYSQVPQIVKAFQRQPILGPFTSFAAEVFRTTANSLKYTAQDLKSSNPKARKAGAQRLAGQMAVLTGGYALSATSRALLGIRAEEEDDARRFLPPWDEAAQLLFTGKEPGKLSYTNLSFANPYSYLTDALTRFISGQRSDDDIATTVGAAFGQLLKPFVSENILASAALDWARNRTATGRQLYSPTASVGEKTEAVMRRFIDALEPGTLTRLKKKIIPALKGETTPQGLELSPAKEIANELTGLKQQTLDFRQALGYRGLKFARDETDAEAQFRRVGLRRGTVNLDEITEAYESAENARFNIWKDLHGDAVAAQRRGVPRGDVLAILKEYGVPKQTASDILMGRYVPYKPSKESVSRSGRALPTLRSPHQGKSLAP